MADIPTFVVAAHQGLHVPFSQTPGPSDCERIPTLIEDPSKFPDAKFLIGNTAPAVSEAFALGANMVSVNLQATADDHVVLYHDADLECRSNGTGLVESRTLKDLREKINIAWKFTPDGKTFPWRDPSIMARGLVMMPTLEEVFDANPGRSFWIVLRPLSRKAARAILTALKPYKDITKVSGLLAEQWVLDMADAQGIEFVHPRINAPNEKDCVSHFLPDHALPPTCANLDFIGILADFVKMAPTIDTFARLMHAFQPPSKLYIGAEDGGYVDDLASAQFVQNHRASFDGLMTDRIDTIGPYFEKHRATRP